MDTQVAAAAQRHGFTTAASIDRYSNSELFKTMIQRVVEPASQTLADFLSAHATIAFVGRG